MTEINSSTTNSNQISTESNGTNQEIILKLNRYIDILKNLQTSSAELFFISSQSDNRYVLYRGVINENSEQTFSEILIDSLKSYLSLYDSNQLEYQEYSSVSLENETNKNALLYLIAAEGSDLPAIPRLEKFIPINNRAEIKLFDIANRLRFWAYTIRLPFGDGDDAVYLFTKASEGNILGNKEHLFKIIDGEYENITDKALALSKTCDSLLIKDTMFIFNSGKFESMFRYSEQYIEDIKTKLPVLTTWGNLSNPGDLIEYCGSDIRKIRRLDRVMKKSNFVTLKPKVIKDMISHYSLNIQFDNNDKMILTKENFVDVLTVLEDYCVKTFGNQEEMIMTTGTSPNNRR